MACGLARTDGTEFLPMWILERICAYKKRSNTMQGLKHVIWDEIQTINQKLLRRDFDDFMNVQQIKQATFKMLSIKSDK
jgi:ERCC4-type nuclease